MKESGIVLTDSILNLTMEIKPQSWHAPKIKSKFSNHESHKENSPKQNAQ